jgi:hypothetical protein
MWRFGGDSQLTAALSYRAPERTAVVPLEMQISQILSSVLMSWRVVAAVSSVRSCVVAALLGYSTYVGAKLRLTVVLLQ